MADADRTRLTRNLDSSFVTEDENGIPVPKTANAALISVETYLRLTQPPEGDARSLLHKQQIASIRAIEEALAAKGPGNQAHEPTTSDIPAAQRQPVKDLRDVLTQKTMDRNRKERSANAGEDRKPCELPLSAPVAISQSPTRGLGFVASQKSVSQSYCPI